MRIVIADTGPLNYLVLIGLANLLPTLFEKVLVPTAVYRELTACKAPAQVRLWLASNPQWLIVHNETPGNETPGNETQSELAADPIQTIDAGEAQAIQLAIFLNADLLLMDDRRGIKVAKSKGLRVTGTLGLLDIAAESNLVDFERAVQLLEQTNFRRPRDILDVLLAKHRKPLGPSST